MRKNPVCASSERSSSVPLKRSPLRYTRTAPAACIRSSTGRYSIRSALMLVPCLRSSALPSTTVLLPISPLILRPCTKAGVLSPALRSGAKRGSVLSTSASAGAVGVDVTIIGAADAGVATSAAATRYAADGALHRIVTAASRPAPGRSCPCAAVALSPASATVSARRRNAVRLFLRNMERGPHHCATRSKSRA